MAETHCGKICSKCTQKEILNCQGYKAQFLSKWLWVLFLITISTTIADLMTKNFVAKSSPSVFLVGQILSAVCSLVYGIILMKMSVEEDRYRTAGICALVGTIIRLLVAILDKGVEGMTLPLILTIPSVIAVFVGEYNEYMAHSVVLMGMDDDLSSKWRTLWKWYVGLFLGMIGCIIVMLSIPLLGYIATICVISVAIGVAVIGILKLVYLYRTTKVFREYQPDDLIPMQKS